METRTFTVEEMSKRDAMRAAIMSNIRTSDADAFSKALLMGDAHAACEIAGSISDEILETYGTDQIIRDMTYALVMAKSQLDVWVKEAQDKILERMEK